MASTPGPDGDRARIRVLRVIARMNVGGPAYHVSILSGLLDKRRWETLLLSGRVGGGEASSADLAERYGARHVTLATLRPELRPLDDARALLDVWRAARRFRPHIVHTHTAKAGLIGRGAAQLLRPRPIVVHTYHGHVLEGYFGPLQSTVYRWLERLLARGTDRLIGVSSATVDDLVRLGVAPRNRFEVIPLGLDLGPFLALALDPNSPFRDEVGAATDAVLLTFVGRLVPIKRVDVLLHAFSRARGAGAVVRLAVVGDGPERGRLEALAASLGSAEHVRFVGFRKDLENILAGTDIAVLTSDNEGTPVSLIEAAAAGRPLIATRVGGVADVVVESTGILAERGDVEGLSAAIGELAADADRRLALGQRARDYVATRFTHDALLHRMALLYERLLAQPRR
jgi:glycosyltransferase involved in cell wall biosynthesis